MENASSIIQTSNNDDTVTTAHVKSSDDYNTSDTVQSTSENSRQIPAETIEHDNCEGVVSHKTHTGHKSRKDRKTKNKETVTNDDAGTGSCSQRIQSTADAFSQQKETTKDEQICDAKDCTEVRNRSNGEEAHLEPTGNSAEVKFKKASDKDDTVKTAHFKSSDDLKISDTVQSTSENSRQIPTKTIEHDNCEVVVSHKTNTGHTSRKDRKKKIKVTVTNDDDVTESCTQRIQSTADAFPQQNETTKDEQICDAKDCTEVRERSNSEEAHKDPTGNSAAVKFKKASDNDDTVKSSGDSKSSENIQSTLENSRQIPAETIEHDNCEVVVSHKTHTGHKSRKDRKKKIKVTVTSDDDVSDSCTQRIQSTADGARFDAFSDQKETTKDEQICDVKDCTEVRDRSNAEEAHLEPTEHSAEVEFKMNSSISNLIKEGQKARDSGDIKKAKQCALQAMIGATETMEDFLKRAKKDLSAQPLSDSFGTLAVILNETKSFIPAIRCFYTATVFDDDWSVADHVRVSRILWDALLKQIVVVLKQTEKVFEVLIKVYEVAELALKRQRFHLCTRICHEIDEVYVLLVKQFQVCPLDRYIAAIKPVYLCGARSHYLTGEYGISGSMCAAVLLEMCNYDCPKALELWGLALLEEKEPELAESKLQLAYKYAKDETSKIRLRDLLEKVSKELESPADVGEVPNRLRFGHLVTDIGRQFDITVQKTSVSSQDPSRTGSVPGINFYAGTHSDETDEESLVLATPVQCPTLEDVQEVSTFYERSRRFHRNEGLSDDINESVYHNLLMNGITLNMSFMSQFEDKHNYNRDPYYSEFKSKERLLQMLGRPERFMRCEIHVESAHVSYCKPLDSTVGIETVEISGRSKAGQTFNGDECVVQLLDARHDEKGKRYGRVEGILNRSRCKDVEHPVFLCTIDDMRSHLMRPICKTVPKISILNQVIHEKFPKLKQYKVEMYNYDENSETLGDPEIIDVDRGDLHKYVFMVAFIKWSRRKIYPRGAVIKMLNFGDTLTSGLLLLDLKHAVTSLYSSSVVDSLENAGYHDVNEIDTNTCPDRDDLTKLAVFTIDPEGSRDLDDALSILRDGEGFKVGVHIADVSEFVKMNDAIDEEASKRATTFYPCLPGKLPRNMLPEPLSCNACSLLPNKCRYTLSVFFHLSASGDILNKNTVDVRKTLVRSHEQFTYREVQDIIEGKHHKFEQEISMLHHLARQIRKARLGNSMFAIDILKDDNDDVRILSKTFEAHYVIEEFMIMANAAVARKLVKAFPDRVPLRCQPPPTKEHLTKFLQENGALIDVVVKLQDKTLSSGKTPCLTTLLGTLPNQSDMACIRVPRHIWKIIKSGSQDVSKVLCADDLYPLQHLIQHHWIAIRKPAEYKCSGGIHNEGRLKHYELDLYPYTHFTSPIRRYADLVVHRLLHAVIDGKICPYSRNEIKEVCQHVNNVSKNAKDYQRACTSLKQAIELKKNPKMMYCFVDEITDRSITLASPDLINVASNNRELAFNLLDMGYKPELETNPSANISTITATWKKRLYDMTAVSTLMSDKKKNIMLDSNQGVVFVPLTKWARLLKCAVGEQFKDLQRAIANTEAITLHSGNSDDVSTESLNAILQPNTTFSLTFKQGQMVKIQLSAVPLKGILTPRPMMYNMTKNVKLCLQHTDDPVLYLSRYFNRCTIDQYRDIDLYLSRWIPLIEMEAATCAVANEDSCVVGNVPMRFRNENEGNFSISTNFCDVRNIEFSGTISEIDGEYADDSAEAYDWLCLRYALSNIDTKQSSISKSLDSIWVGHAQITGVKKMKPKKPNDVDQIVVNFKLHERCPVLPSEARRKDSKFCVEILRKSEVDRRTESCLKRLKLPSYSNVLAYTIALNLKPIPPLDTFHVNLAKRIERDLYIQTKLPKNNMRQQEAIDKAMNHKLTLIQGPPGTGKTYTGIKLLYLFDKVNEMICREKGEQRKQILFCGPSNKSVDLVGNRLIDKLGKLCPKFVRVYGRSIESKEFPIPGKSFLSKKSTHALKADENLKPMTLHHLIRKDGNPFAKQIRAYDKRFKENNYVASLDDVKKYEKILRDASVEEIKKYGVILCTTAVGSNPKILEASNVYQVLVDEAGMCPEPQCLMPIIATKAEQVVLIGDHKQLCPIIICKEAAELGLQKSLFEKYVTSNSAKGKLQFTMLNWQYRMNPELCSFPSEEFYDSELKTKYANAWAKGDRLWYIWPTRNDIPYPHVLIPVEGEERSLTVSTDEGNEHSKSNLAEVDVVMKILRYFIEVGGVEGDQVNVMSQYNAQCAEIRNRIKGEGLQNCNVSTVVSSQGGEWDYVIFSTVRTLPAYQIEKNPTLGWCQQKLGFITDKNQINVALTRARKGLIIIGNPNLLKCDEVFRNLISRYETYGCIKNKDEFPPPRTRLQKLEAADNRHWQLYGEARFIPGLGSATSYRGDVDNVPDHDDDDDDSGRRVFRRGKHKTLPARKK